MEKFEPQSGQFHQSEAFPADGDLIHLYEEIEQAATAAVENGQIVGNPYLKGTDTRYGVSPDVLVVNSPVSTFLAESLRLIRQAEPTSICVPSQDLHMTQGEIYFSEQGNRGRVSGEKLRSYYHALRDNLPDYEALHLRLYKLLPALDPKLPGSDNHAMTIVAAFLTDDDSTIFHLRRDIRVSVEEAGLPTASRIGVPKVLFVSMARLIDPPRREKGKIPILEVLNSANNIIPLHSTLTVDRIHLISTARVNYVMPKGYITVEPAIMLSKEKRSFDFPRFVRPSQLHR